MFLSVQRPFGPLSAMIFPTGRHCPQPFDNAGQDFQKYSRRLPPYFGRSAKAAGSRGRSHAADRWPAAHGSGRANRRCRPSRRRRTRLWRSSIKSRDSPSMPSKQRLTLPGSRWTRSPFKRDRGICSAPSISLSRRALRRSRRSATVEQACFMAAARPTMPATFSVPARRPRSCAPPSMRFGSRMPFLI